MLKVGRECDREDDCHQPRWEHSDDRERFNDEREQEERLESEARGEQQSDEEVDDHGTQLAGQDTNSVCKRGDNHGQPVSPRGNFFRKENRLHQ